MEEQDLYDQVFVKPLEAGQIVEDGHLQGNICPQLLLGSLEHSISTKLLRTSSIQSKRGTTITRTTRRNISTHIQRFLIIRTGI